MADPPESSSPAARVPGGAARAETDLDALPAARPGRWLIFAIVSAGLMMSAIDQTIVATALPAIHQSLRASINWASWTITVYGLGLVIALPIAGKLSDQFGRRLVFLVGVALFTLASLLCGVSGNIVLLVCFRGLQALGGGSLQPSATGIVADHFGPGRDRAIGMFGTIAASGQVVGPVLGGLLVSYLSWRWIFFVNVPVGIGLCVLTVMKVPRSRPIARTAGIDVRGLCLTAALLLSAMFGITILGVQGTAIYSPQVVVPEVSAAVLLWLLIRHTRTASAPFIPVWLLRRQGFAAVNVINVLWGAAGFGMASLVPLYAEQRYHVAALSAGTLLTARAVGMMVLGTVAAIALRRTGYRMPMVAGFLILAAGMLLMSIAPRYGLSPYAWLSVGASITGIGLGIANPAARNACIQLAPNDVAVIAGLRNMFNYIGIIFSVAVVTAILNRSADPALLQAHVFWVMAGVLVAVMTPLVFRIPEHRGKW